MKTVIEAVIISGLAAILAGIIIVAILGLFATSPRQCETFGVGVQTEQGPVFFGQVELCGENLEWGEVQSPIKGEGVWR